MRFRPPVRKVLRTRHAVRAALLASLLVLSATLLLACESPEGVPGVSPDDGEANGARDDYRLILAGAISDTLRGTAVFGPVIRARNRAEQMVIKLETGVDFVGGMFITRGSTELPDRGTYQLADASSAPESLSPDAFYVVYREGLLRQLRSRAGTVTFDVVSDTLITGSIEATLAGMVATRTGMRPGEVHVSGPFAASSGIVGFLVGI